MKTRPRLVESNQFYGRRNMVDDEDSRFTEYYTQYIRKNNVRSHRDAHPFDSEYIRYASPRSSVSSLEECHHQPARRLSDNPSPPKRFRPNSPEEHFNFYNDESAASCPKKSVHFPVRKSPPPLTSADDKDSSTKSSHNGRFRPPPFFETVFTLRKRLYNMGGSIFPVDEPPSDRNVHKLWRSMEKHKVSYVSLLMQFFEVF